MTGRNQSERLVAITRCAHIIAFVGEQRLDPVGNHPEQRDKTQHVVGLPRRQHEAKRPTFGVTPGMEFGGETAA